MKRYPNFRNSVGKKCQFWLLKLTELLIGVIRFKYRNYFLLTYLLIVSK